MRNLEALKHQALDFATGIVEDVQLNSVTSAYVYLHWRSDYAVDVDILGFFPSPQIKDREAWKYACNERLREFTKAAKEKVKGLVNSTDKAIGKLCSEYDVLVQKMSPIEGGKAKNLFADLDDMTEKRRETLEKKYQKLTKKAGGIWRF